MAAHPRQGYGARRLPDQGQDIEGIPLIHLSGAICGHLYITPYRELYKGKYIVATSGPRQDHCCRGQCHQLKAWNTSNSLPLQGNVINLSCAVSKSLPIGGNVINLRNRPVTAHRNTRRSGGNLPPQKMAWRLIVAATEVLTLVVNAFPITTFAKLTTLPSEGKLSTAG